MNKKTRKILTVILAIAFVLCLVFIVSYYMKLRRASAVYEDMQAPQAEQVTEDTEVSDWTEPEESVYGTETEEMKVVDEQAERQIDFDSLKEQNSDIYAWISVPGTQTDYPVLQNTQSTDIYNDYYLNHTVERLEGYPGSIYSESCNSMDFTDPNTVLYGHNMKNGSMFGSLHSFEDEDFFKEHDKIYIYTPEETLVYEIYAAVTFSNAHIMKSYDFSEEEGVQNYIDDVNNCDGLFREGMELEADRQILTLSTCISGHHEHRFLVVAALQDTITE